MSDTQNREQKTESTPRISDDMLIILPVRNLVLFPGTVMPVAINRERSLAGAQEAVRTERKVGFLSTGHGTLTVDRDRQHRARKQDHVAHGQDDQHVIRHLRCDFGLRVLRACLSFGHGDLWLGSTLVISRGD